MIKPLLRFGLTALTATLFGATGRIPLVQAATFGQQEVDQSKLIAIAAPRGNTGAYQLLILEQTSAQRPCWSESGSNPTVVEPLLLTFNFTGICDRKTDSNGFSIRMGGEDLALNYNLRVVRTTNDLVLIGYPSRDRNAPIIEIGRAYGVIPGEFAKITLNPNWRFAKRTFGEKTLGHIYLASDISLAEMAATTAPPALPTAPPTLPTAPASLETAAPESPAPLSPTVTEAGEDVETETRPPIVLDGQTPTPGLTVAPPVTAPSATPVTEGAPAVENAPAAAIREVIPAGIEGAPGIVVETAIEAEPPSARAPGIVVETAIEAQPPSQGEAAIAGETEASAVPTVESVESEATPASSTPATNPLQIPKSDQEFVVPTQEPTPTFW